MTYDELVKKINEKSYHEDFDIKKGLPLQEINAWTYWQGVGVRNPKIMIVGQDWGNIEKAKKYFYAIEEMMTEGVNHHDDVCYFKYVPKVNSGGKDFATDLNLANGLKYLGYKDVLRKRYPDLFFTNLIPGYRKNDKSTGGFKSSWITTEVKEDFRGLIELLQPQVVICLGRDTFKHATRIMGIKNVFGKMSWNDYLNKQNKPVEIKLASGKISFFFAMPHPGYFGVYNRSKCGQIIDDDWKKVGEWMNKHLNLTVQE